MASPHADRAVPVDQFAVVEASVLDDMFAGDDAARSHIVGLFFDEADAKVGQLATAVAERDADAVARLTHALQGDSGAVGAYRLAELARLLGRSARSYGLERAAQLEAELEAVYAATRAALA